MRWTCLASAGCASGVAVDASDAPWVGPGLLRPPASIADESTVCWFFGDREELYAVGMDSGAIERVGDFGPIGAVDSLTYTGTTLLASGQDAVVQLDLATSTTRVVQLPGPLLGGLVPLRGKLVLVDHVDDHPTVYPDWTAFDADAPSGHLPPLEPGTFSRVQVDGDLLYGAWHSANAVDVWDLTTGDHLDQVVLDDHTWVWGVGVAAGRIHLLDDGWEPRISRFDAVTGARVNDVDVSSVGAYAGLYCAAP